VAGKLGAPQWARYGRRCQSSGRSSCAPLCRQIHAEEEGSGGECSRSRQIRTGEGRARGRRREGGEARRDGGRRREEDGIAHATGAEPCRQRSTPLGQLPGHAAAARPRGEGATRWRRPRGRQSRVASGRAGPRGEEGWLAAEQRQAAQGGAPASGGSSFGGATSSAIEREGGGVCSRPEAAECAGEEDKEEKRKRKGKKRANRKEKKLESHGPQ